MAFSSRRGRPRLERAKKDCGTKELAQRHAAGLTMEALDMCLKRGLISEEEHKAGMHLRWLYTLRFGAPTIAAYDHAAIQGRNLKKEDDAWRGRREKEYEQAMAWLKGEGAHIMVGNVAIFNRFPRFLFPSKIRLLTEKHAEIAQITHMQELQTLQQGLSLLHEIFTKMRSRAERSSCYQARTSK